MRRSDPLSRREQAGRTPFHRRNNGGKAGRQSRRAQSREAAYRCNLARGARGPVDPAARRSSTGRRAGAFRAFTQRPRTCARLSGKRASRSHHAHPALSIARLPDAPGGVPILSDLLALCDRSNAETRDGARSMVICTKDRALPPVASGRCRPRPRATHPER